MACGKSNKNGYGTPHVHMLKGNRDSGSSMTAMAATVEVHRLVSSMDSLKENSPVSLLSVGLHGFQFVFSVFLSFSTVYTGALFFNTFSMVSHVFCMDRACFP